MKYKYTTFFDEIKNNKQYEGLENELSCLDDYIHDWDEDHYLEKADNGLYCFHDTQSDFMSFGSAVAWGYDSVKELPFLMLDIIEEHNTLNDMDNCKYSLASATLQFQNAISAGEGLGLLKGQEKTDYMNDFADKIIKLNSLSEEVGLCRGKANENHIEFEQQVSYGNLDNGCDKVAEMYDRIADSVLNRTLERGIDVKVSDFNDTRSKKIIDNFNSEKNIVNMNKEDIDR